MTYADKEINPIYFRNDPAEIRIHIRINPEIRIPIPDQISALVEFALFECSYFIVRCLTTRQWISNSPLCPSENKESSNSFNPTKSTRYDTQLYLTSAPPCQLSRLSGQKCGNTTPYKTVKISNFGQKFVPQRDSVAIFLTKCSAFVRVYR